MNPEIYSINLVDLTPVRDFLGDFVDAQGARDTARDADQAAALRNAATDQAEFLRLALAAGVLLFVVFRRA